MLTIRPATPDDIPLIAQLIRELAEYEREPQSAKATEADLHRNLFGEGVGKGPVAECLIGLVDGAPQGMALFFSNFSTWTGRAGIYLEDLFVRPQARGAGLGKALLGRLAQLAIERGCRRLEWAVLDWNEPAIGFYRRLGARPMDGWTVWRLDGEALERMGGRRE
ncbi:MAG: GNAT family N-acetyltransferase [Phycisphaerales bacterium JB039]